MGSIVELARYPEIKSVSIADDSDEQTVLLPVDCMGFVIFSPTADTTVYWAVEADQATSATGRRRTVPAGEVGGATGLKLRNNETLYLAASGAATIELEVYTRA